MIYKYSQAVANAMKGKCIPYKRETKAVLNEMLDIVTVKHGEWISNDLGGYKWTFHCSLCGFVDGYPFNDRFQYCPNCGAKMTND